MFKDTIIEKMEHNDMTSQDIKQYLDDICLWYEEGGEQLVTDKLSDAMKTYENHINDILNKIEEKL